MPDPTFPPAGHDHNTFSCPKLPCPSRGLWGTSHIAHRSWTGMDKHIERLRCKAWGQECSERRVHWGPRTQESAAPLIAQLVARRYGLPVWLRDGWKAYPAARLQVRGGVSQRRRRGRRGRHPKPCLVPPQELCYGQVVKVRHGTGKLLRVVSWVV